MFEITKFLICTYLIVNFALNHFKIYFSKQNKYLNKWLKSALKPTRLWYKIVYWETMTINIFKLRKNYFCFIQGCYSFFPIFFSGFPNFFKVFKSTHFWTKAKFNVKTVLNTIKNIERYCKVTLNVFYNKKIFDDDKKILFIL